MTAKKHTPLRVIKGGVLPVALMLAWVTVALAGQESGHQGHDGHAMHATEQTTGVTAATANEWISAEVRKLDLVQGRVTLRHERIESLDMAPMTMVFRLGEGVATDNLVEGAQVRFQVVRDTGTGRLMITALELASNE
jgi:Cu/Ag efflux protein CusF